MNTPSDKPDAAARTEFDQGRALAGIGAFWDAFEEVHGRAPQWDELEATICDALTTEKRIAEAAVRPECGALPWAHPVRADHARGYIVDRNDNYVCVLRAPHSDEYNEEIAKALNAYGVRSGSGALSHGGGPMTMRECMDAEDGGAVSTTQERK